jgi:hypothetical protein
MAPARLGRRLWMEKQHLRLSGQRDRLTKVPRLAVESPAGVWLLAELGWTAVRLPGRSKTVPNPTW